MWFKEQSTVVRVREEGGLGSLAPVVFMQVASAFACTSSPRVHLALAAAPAGKLASSFNVDVHDRFECVMHNEVRLHIHM